MWAVTTSQCGCGACGQDILDDKRRTPLACFAVRERRTDCVRVILEHGVELEGFVTGMAAVNGNLPCLRLAHEFGDELDPASYLAACGGTCPSRCHYARDVFLFLVLRPV
jgi:hypothetical protein